MINNVIFFVKSKVLEARKYYKIENTSKIENTQKSKVLKILKIRNTHKTQKYCTKTFNNFILINLFSYK